MALDDNVAERPMLCIACKNDMFVSSERCGKSTAVIYTLFETAKLKSVNPQAWINDTLSPIADYKSNKIYLLLWWNYTRWNGRL
ncbi:MAG: transposase domain-containing protein [Roseobacter sp.]